jgi:tetratricopeptide (TPR) repeat protein
MKTILRACITLLVLAPTLAATRASADEVAASKDATFRRANEAYFKGRYTEAIEAYEQVVALGVASEDLYFNLGNAYFKNGALGPAIYNYERARALDPTLDDVEYNLRAAREAVKKKGEDRLVGEEATPLWMRVIHVLTLGVLSWIFLGVYVAVFALLITLHFVGPGFLRVGLWTGFAFAVAGAIGFGGLTAGRLYFDERVLQAVVLPDTVAVKEGPDANYQSMFRVHAGLKVRVTEKDQDWVRVRLSNGLEGWVREREIGRL